MIKSIDHILVAVEDLDKAVKDYSLVFGFGPTWQGSHPSQGTKNALFPLENMYLELIGKEYEGPLGEFIGEHLKKNGESVFGLALETDDIEKAKKKLSLSFDTDLEISDGKGVNTISKKERHWKNILLPMSITRGVFTLLIEHTGGTLPHHKDADESEITRMDHVVINSNDPDGMVDLYKEKYGIRLALDQFVEKWGGRMLFFRTNDTTIEAIGIKKDGSPRDSLWGLAWTTKNIKKTHARLMSEGVEISDVKDGRKPSTLVATIKSHTCNIPTLLIEHLK
jgi:catechol 2,3-dioxygenase-like lactoylglutathione lyase family enzyme